MFVLMYALAFIVTEGTVEFLLGVPFDKIAFLKPYKWLLMYASAGLGIFLAIYYSIDPMTLFSLPQSTVGCIIGGILIGRGANFINDIWQKFFPGSGARE